MKCIFQTSASHLISESHSATDPYFNQGQAESAETPALSSYPLTTAQESIREEIPYLYGYPAPPVTEKTENQMSLTLRVLRL